MTPIGRALSAGAVVATAAVATLLWRGHEDAAPSEPTRPASETVSAPAPGASSTAPPAAVAASQPDAGQGVEVPAAAVPLAAAELGTALTDLIGRKAVLTFLQLDDFARRLVATVDNLGRIHAPSRLWPVNPMPGRFMVEPREGGTVIAADNSLRYTPFVLLVETVDVARAVDLYVRLYPELQRSYEELGYPHGYFNQRLLQVIDQLLATPQVPQPLRVQLTEVKGPIPAEQPWTRYELADPELEAMSAGQKMLLRTGEVNARRLKAKLAEFRMELLRHIGQR
ncbi:DUF3014 domain-containing protein [Azohydromonas lata]|uniref:DUF3014 domain-containing protein n=1 Tax=Azohydromonas lata TaxID=45677 RepID=UPI000837A161|nr:DUF3014 domain-containing protein [Azohydromonas lata]